MALRIEEPCRRRIPAVRVVTGLGHAAGSTVVFLYGDLGYASKRRVERALDPLRGHLIVDLSWCSSIDSTIVALILAKHVTLARDGDRVEVIVPAARQLRAIAFDRLAMSNLLPADGPLRAASPQTQAHSWNALPP